MQSYLRIGCLRHLISRTLRLSFLKEFHWLFRTRSHLCITLALKFPRPKTWEPRKYEKFSCSSCRFCENQTAEPEGPPLTHPESPAKPLRGGEVLPPFLFLPIGRDNDIGHTLVALAKLLLSLGLCLVGPKSCDRVLALSKVCANELDG